MWRTSIFWTVLVSGASLLAATDTIAAQQHHGGRPWHRGYYFPRSYYYVYPPTYFDLYGGYSYDFFPPSTGFTYAYAAPQYSYDASPQPLAPPISQEATPAVSRVQVVVPVADARVWVDGKETTTQGTVRSFESPPLAPGRTSTYTIRASWLKEGQKVERDRQVHVSAGSLHIVDFTREESPERLGAPR